MFITYLDHFANAKLAVKGGEYTKWRKHGEAVLKKRFDNWHGHSIYGEARKIKRKTKSGNADEEDLPAD